MKLDAIKYSLVALFLSVFLSGCLNYEQITTLKTDGSGKMYVHYWMKYKQPADSILIEKLGLFNQDSLRREFTSKYTEIEFVEVYKDISDSVVHSKLEFNFSNIDSLNHMNVFKGLDFNFDDSNEDYTVFTQNVYPYATGLGFNLDSIQVDYTYYIPGKVIEHNANEINNNELIWRFSLNQLRGKNSLQVKFIPYKLKETPTWLYYIVLSVLLLVLVFLFKKRKP